MADVGFMSNSLFSGETKIISKTMLKKISGSGLSYGHMKCVLERNSSATVVLMAKINGQIRVT